MQEIWPTKMDFGWLNAEIGRKMANGRLLFLALKIHTNVDLGGRYCKYIGMYVYM